MAYFRFLTAACFCVLAGCGGGGDSGPPRYDLSGAVTFDGQPVPAGEIFFQPASGPGGSAQIVDGKYDTREGKGIVGGPHTIMIQGFDGHGGAPGEMGKPLFKPYSVDMELPSTSGTQDFEVPASAAEGMVISDDPA